jgi:hypothetical protein
MLPEHSFILYNNCTNKTTSNFEGKYKCRCKEFRPVSSLLLLNYISRPLSFKTSGRVVWERLGCGLSLLWNLLWDSMERSWTKGMFRSSCRVWLEVLGDFSEDTRLKGSDSF